MSKLAKKVMHNFKLQKKTVNFSIHKHTNNGLTVVHYPFSGTGVITTNIVYNVGSVDEKRGQSGLAHMLEHMLFKPTKQDLKKGIIGGSAMGFERETGAQLNASTAYDRTNYYFSFPKTYTGRVLEIEANRMNDVVLSDTEFQPERNNVLSEFDMYNGDPYFALEVALRTATFQSHAYDHEIIGFREDIEDYTVEKLQKFYDMYYQPNNATIVIAGDMKLSEALEVVGKKLGSKKNKISNIRRETAREPKISGPKTVTIERPGTTNILAFSFLADIFPSANWYALDLAFAVLAGGPESILHKALVDTGKVSSIDEMVHKSPQPNCGLLAFRLAEGTSHRELEKEVRSIIDNLDIKKVTKLLKKEKTKAVTAELFGRASSLGVAARMTEYIACNAVEEFDNFEAKMQNVTAKDIVNIIKKPLDQNTVITGYYKSV